ncbi:hypothetical protein BJ170DRAFT_596698 [Xylariales sp. AK1849]|nr:hypothetical protein BJ170DRAFT_596698 [Xylariales sp. AK1849]
MNKARVQKPARHGVQVVLRSKPRPYTRGSGPALAPLSLALQDDSTAHVTGKTILPTRTKYGGVKLQMHYIVQWTDLPAASVAIPATTVLDHVSPRTLEDFEYKVSLERDTEEERQRQKAEIARQAVAELDSLPAASSTPSAAGSGKKRGRPRKEIDILMRKAANASGENVSSLLPAATTSGPSLSTPQKSLGLESAADDLVMDEEDVGDANLEDAIFRQLYGDSTRSNRGEDETNADTKIERADGIARALMLENKSPRDGLRAAIQIDGVPASPFSSTAASLPAPKRPSAPSKHLVQTTLGASGFTPAGRSSGRWPSPSPSHTLETRTATHQPVVDFALNSSRKQEKKKKKKKVKKKAAEGAPTIEETVYEVKRLEAVKVLGVGDKQERQFRVRWEGNWPNNQNPTWEPEENLPRKLVKKYLKKTASVANKVPMDVDDVPASPFVLVRKYSSVAEAFASETELSTGHRSRRNVDDDNEEEERLLVEEGEETSEPTRRASIRRSDSLDFTRARELTSFNGNGHGHH